jgi:hypothetical protein
VEEGLFLGVKVQVGKKTHLLYKIPFCVIIESL